MPGNAHSNLYHRPLGYLPVELRQYVPARTYVDVWYHTYTRYLTPLVEREACKKSFEYVLALLVVNGGLPIRARMHF